MINNTDSAEKPLEIDMEGTKELSMERFEIDKLQISNDLISFDENTRLIEEL